MNNVTITALVTALCLPYVASGQNPPPAPRPRSEIVKAAADVMQRARYCALVTIGEDGQPQARVVDPFAPEADLTVWIATKPVTRKVGQIRADPRVTLFYFDPGGPSYVTLIGTAELVSDPAAKSVHWKEEWAAFYKDKNRGDDYLLIRVRPRRLEIVSASHGLLSDPQTWRPVIVEFRSTGAISGRVVDWAGALPGALVRIRPRDAGPGAPAPGTVSGTDGRFQVGNLPAGDYEIAVNAPGSETTAERVVHVGDASSASVVIEAYRGCDTLADESGSLTEADEHEVTRLAIEDALRSELAAGVSRLVLSSAHMPAHVDLSRIRSAGVELLAPAEIRERAEHDGDVWFLEIAGVRIHGGCMAVRIDRRLERQKGATPAVLGGAGLINEFRRTAAGWSKKRVCFVES